MKGITGHRVHDAYASMAVTPSAQVKQKQATPANARAAEDAAQVRISDGARRLAQGSASDPAKIEAMKEKVALGPSAFDPQIVAQKLLGELSL